MVLKKQNILHKPCTSLSNCNFVIHMAKKKKNFCITFDDVKAPTHTPCQDWTTCALTSLQVLEIRSNKTQH